MEEKSNNQTKISYENEDKSDFKNDELEDISSGDDNENFDQEENIKQDDEKNSETEIKDANIEIEVYKEKLLRISAEYENYRKRTEKEKAQIFSNATEISVLNLLPVIDSLEMAFNSLGSNNTSCEKGLEMVKNQLVSSLEKMNITSFGQIGEEFTPDLHNAASHIEKEDLGKNVISSVFQKGYKHGEKVIRHATVQVAN